MIKKAILKNKKISTNKINNKLVLMFLNKVTKTKQHKINKNQQTLIIFNFSNNK